MDEQTASPNTSLLLSTSLFAQKRNRSESASANVLVVDSESLSRDMFSAAIRKAGHQCFPAGRVREALKILASDKVDVVVTDIRLPDGSGLDLTHKIRTRFSADVMVMTRDVRNFSYDKVIDMGARDFINKPVRLTEFLARLKRVLHERALRRDLDNAYSSLESAHLDTVNRLSMAAEYKDEEPYEHIVRMGRYCRRMARHCGMSDQEIQWIRHAAPMHDVGKIGIPDRILLKQGKLTDAEFEVMKSHCMIGARLLDNSDSHILKMARIIAASHHERWDGNGYPAGLRRRDTPLAGRIVAIVDSFDALTSRRPYRQALSLETALDILKKEREKHYDPEILDIFLDKVDEMIDIRNHVAEAASDDPLHLFFKESDRDFDLRSP